MGRMRLTVETGGQVTIAYDDWCDGRVTRTFAAPKIDGPCYVIEYLRHGRTGQVCEELASMGDTLRASRETLASVIRREYRAMRRAEHKLRERM